MAFPDVVVECAFDNDVNEYLYAQAGYTDITPWVRSVSGDLRGRRYEMETVETGSIRIVLDNADGRFTPGTTRSPYYPFVKPSRRLRIRGHNKQRPNIASAGSTLRSVRGFLRSTYAVSAVPSDPALVDTTALNSPVRSVFHTNEVRDPETTATTSYAGWQASVALSGDGWVRATVTTAATNTSVRPTPASGTRWPTSPSTKMASRVRVRGMATKDLYVKLETVLFRSDGSTKIEGGPNSGWVSLPQDTEIIVECAGTAPSDPLIANVQPHLYIASSEAGAAPALNDYVDVTEWYFELGSSAPTTLVVSLPYFTGDTESGLVREGYTVTHRWTGTANSSSSQQISSPIGTGSHHIEVTVPNGTASGEKGLLEWNVPVELGRRVAHSVYVWKVSGTEPAGSMYIKLRYFDANGNALSESPSQTWTLPSPTTPTRRYITHTAPATAARAVISLVGNWSASFTSNVVYAVDAIMASNTPSLALNPSGAADALHWYVTGTAGTLPTVNGTDQAITATMAADGTDHALYTLVGGTVPGETYTVVVELRHFTAAMGTPTTSLLLSADEGQTGTVVTGQGAYSTATLTFVADSTSQRLAITMSDGSDFLAGWVVRARRLAVIPGSSSPGLHTDGTTTHDLMAWESPKPVFEGWIESWPVRVERADGTISVVANDRLRRIGGIKLDNTWREAVFSDAMELVVPFDDDPTDAAGKVAQVGLWASTDQVIEVPVLTTKGDLGVSAYVLGVDGPADPTAVEMNPASATSGYFWCVPYSKDYSAPSAPPPPPPAPKPPASTATYTTKQYTKVYYATWSRTYDGDNGTTWDDNALMYQGYYSGTRGNTKSLAGFNYAAIKADLVGATIKSCVVTLDNEECYAFGGTTVYVGTHTYASKPATWSTSSVSERRFAKAHSYGANVSVSLGTTVGNEFKAGTTKGIAIGPPGSTDRYYYSKYRGATQSGRPYLTITYTKLVAV